jgi:tetratricopeptide (TPR) repeat protein
MNTSHFLLNGANLYMMRAGNVSANQDEKIRNLADAKRNLLQAIAQGQEGNPSAWFLLGGLYAMQGDLRGADTALIKAEAGMPLCLSYITRIRRSLWTPIVNRGVSAQQRNDFPGAKRAFTEANAILHTDPTTYYYLASMSANESQTYSAAADSIRKGGTHADSVKADSVKRMLEAAIDTAVDNYRITIRLANDSANRATKALQDLAQTATFNSARLFHRRKNWDSAAAYYTKVRDAHPNDAQALTGLATVYAAAGKLADAQKLYDTVLVRADSLDPLDLFAAGVELFKGGTFDRAAQALRLGLARNPYHRDALYNLANTYLSMANDAQGDIDSITALARKAAPAAPAGRRGAAGRAGAGAPARPAGPDTSMLPRLRAAKKQAGDSMLPVVRRLNEVDPQNKISLRLLAAAYQQTGNDDSTLAILGRWHSLPFEVTVNSLDVTPTGARISGFVSNLTAAQAAEPVVTFELLDGTGKTVTTTTVPAAPLAANTSFGFDLTATGAHIVAWRYKVGS